MRFRFSLQIVNRDFIFSASCDPNKKIQAKEPLPSSLGGRIKIVGSPRHEPVSNT
jgi:hypothetical protein